MYSGSKPQTRQLKQPVQVTALIRLPQLCRRLLPVAAAVMLAGCGSVPASINPVAWWHDLQGGAIAEQRPPPPGATEPYPNISTVPERPVLPDPAVRLAINQSLLADRASAQQAAASTPIPDLAAPAAAAAPPAAAASAAATAPAAATVPAPPGPPSDAPGLSASFAAATAPPPAPAPRRPAPARDADADAGVLGPQPQGSTAQMGALPPLPGSPPPPANLPGASPVPPPPAKQIPPPPAGMPLAAGSIVVPFAPAATTLSPEAAAAVHAAAVQTRPTTRIVVTGYGDAGTSDPSTQATALTPAMLRAQAIARALTAEGIPAGAIASDAQAEGRGGAVRLVN